MMDETKIQTHFHYNNRVDKNIGYRQKKSRLGISTASMNLSDFQFQATFNLATLVLPSFSAA